MQERLKYVREKIKKIRLREGMSQQQLGDLIGTTSQHISNIELGKASISIDLLILISDALKVSPNDLIGYKGHNDVIAIMNDCDIEERILISRIINDIDGWYHRKEYK